MKRLFYILIILAILFVAYKAYASSAGPNGTGTGADDASVGTITWTAPGNITADDSSYASSCFNGATPFFDSSVKSVKGGTIGGTEKATNTTISSTEGYVSYGGSADLWGQTWTPADINASTFGVVFSYTSSAPSADTSHYLKATNFGFSIPTNATVNGILMEVKEKSTLTCPATGTVSVNYVRATIYYTVSGTPQVQVRSGTMKVKSGALILK